jgi:hypothetical protein
MEWTQNSIKRASFRSLRLGCRVGANRGGVRLAAHDGGLSGEEANALAATNDEIAEGLALDPEDIAGVFELDVAHHSVGVAVRGAVDLHRLPASIVSQAVIHRVGGDG